MHRQDIKRSKSCRICEYFNTAEVKISPKKSCSGTSPLLKHHAGVMELADVTDSKSVDGDIVWVRVPPPAPIEMNRPFGRFILILQHRTRTREGLSLEKQSGGLFFRQSGAVGYRRQSLGSTSQKYATRLHTVESHHRHQKETLPKRKCLFLCLCPQGHNIVLRRNRKHHLVLFNFAFFQKPLVNTEK